MKKLFCAIDNGVSGTIGIISDNSIDFIKTPIKSEQNYTKKKGNITRIDFNKLREYLAEATKGYSTEEIIVALERPMVNPTRFQATTSALRALEATLIAVETLDLPYFYIDSKEWQKELLPNGTKGDALKKASVDIGSRLFPQFKDIKHPDRDGILMAEYLRRKFA
ncbi:MAG: hypothetical protein KC414_13470 [Romboutsia sp.]|nr:hypothetical protein [Romboutsia sp.]